MNGLWVTRNRQSIDPLQCVKLPCHHLGVQLGVLRDYIKNEFERCRIAKVLFPTIHGKRCTHQSDQTTHTVR